MAATIYVPCWKSDPWIERCVGTLAPHLDPDDELVLIDNLQNSRLPAAAALHGRVRIVTTPRPLGFAAANNFGYREAPPRSPFVVFLNQDTATRMPWVAPCVAAMEANPRIGALSPGIEDLDGLGWDDNFLEGLRTNPNYAGADAADHAAAQGKLVSVAYMPAAALVVRTDTIDRVGLFDPIFGSYYEDVDLCRRIREGGFEVAALPAARVGHFCGSATDTQAAVRRRQRWIIRNRIIHVVRSAGDRRLGLLIAAFAGFPRRLARGITRREGAQAVSSILMAYIDLMRIAWRISSRRRDEDAFRRETGFAVTSQGEPSRP